MKNILLNIFFLLASIGFLVQPALADQSGNLNEAMAKYLKNTLPIEQVDVEKQEISINQEKLWLAAIYSSMDMSTIWVNEDGPGKEAAILLNTLGNAENTGLKSSDYNITQIKSLWDKRSHDELTLLDTQLTRALIKYSYDASNGGSKSSQPGDDSINPVQTLVKALSASDFSTYLAELTPEDPQYRELQEKLKRYKEIAANGGFPVIPKGTNLRLGDRSPTIQLIQERFVQTGLMAEKTADPDRYDKQLLPVVKTFQGSFGLIEDGIIGANTYAAFNVPVEELIKKIELEMTR